MKSVIEGHVSSKTPQLNWNGQMPLGGKAKQIATAQDQNGCQHIFYVGLNNHIYQNIQLEPNGVLWSGETPFSNLKANEVTLVQDANAALNLFYIGTDHHIHQHILVDPVHNQWSEAPVLNVLAATMAVARDSFEKLNIVYVATYAGLFHMRQIDPATNEWPTDGTTFGDVGPRQVCMTDLANVLMLVYINGTHDLVRRFKSSADDDSWSGPSEFGAKARQVASAVDALGVPHIFYADTGNNICHDFQTNSIQDTWQGKTPFAKAKGTQIAAGLNKNNLLDAHYLATSGGKLWTLSETSSANLPNNANWSSRQERLDQNLHAVSGKQITIGRNSNGGMEIFYIGNNDHIFHDWEFVPPVNFESNANQFLASNCMNLVGVSVTVTVGEDIVAAVDSGSDNGFSIQLNCWSSNNLHWVWQQYGFSVSGKHLQIWIDNWTSFKDDPVNYQENIAKVPHATLPAGYTLTLSLLNDAAGNITGAHYIVIDNTGNQICDRQMLNKNHYPHVGHIPKAASITSFQVNIVGPDNSEDVLFSSGSGDISYTAIPASPLIPGTHFANPSCTNEIVASTAETSNMVYTSMSPNALMPLTQRFFARLGENV